MNHATDEAMAELWELACYLSHKCERGELLGQLWEQYHRPLPHIEAQVRAELAQRAEQNARAVAWWRSQRGASP